MIKVFKDEFYLFSSVSVFSRVRGSSDPGYAHPDPQPRCTHLQPFRRELFLTLIMKAFPVAAIITRCNKQDSESGSGLFLKDPDPIKPTRIRNPGNKLLADNPSRIKISSRIDGQRRKAALKFVTRNLQTKNCHSLFLTIFPDQVLHDFSNTGFFYSSSFFCVFYYLSDLLPKKPLGN